MPRLSVWLIRTALLYLGVGFTLGGLMLFQKGVPLDGALWRRLPTHIEFVLIGWTMQLATGVAFWILPRFSNRAVRGNENLAWLAYVLLNVGVLSAAVSQWLPGAATIQMWGRIAEAASVASFAAHAWPRVKPLGA